jgi:hypothetical protein
MDDESSSIVYRRKAERISDCLHLVPPHPLDHLVGVRQRRRAGLVEPGQLRGVQLPSARAEVILQLCSRRFWI